MDKRSLQIELEESYTAIDELIKNKITHTKARAVVDFGIEDVDVDSVTGPDGKPVLQDLIVAKSQVLAALAVLEVGYVNQVVNNYPTDKIDVQAVIHETLRQRDVRDARLQRVESLRKPGDPDKVECTYSYHTISFVKDGGFYVCKTHGRPSKYNVVVGAFTTPSCLAVDPE